MQANNKIYLFGGAIFLAIFLGIAVQDTNKGTLPKGQYSFTDIKTIDLNKDYNFAGELVPKDNFDALERLERELLVNAYWHSNSLMMVKKGKRYFPVIEKILAEKGVPDDIKYLAAAESSFYNATSPSGAKGIWQFLEGTAKEYGLEVNNDIDERNNLEKSTRAACDMLTKLKNKFGNWTLAAAAYNMGGSGLAREMDNQRASSYYDMNLNNETLRYVLRLIAIKEIFENPARYGFETEDGQLYKPLTDCSEVTVDSTVNNWGDFAKQFNTSYRMFKVYNPWLVSYGLVNKEKKAYTIKIPR